MSRNRIIASLCVVLVVWGIIGTVLSNRLDSQTERANRYRSELSAKQAELDARTAEIRRMRNDISKLSKDLDATKKRLQAAEASVRTYSTQLSRLRASRSSARATGPASRSYSGGVRKITAYCPTGNRTASGKWPTPGMVATANRSIPFGTRVSIEGLGVYRVEDRIGHGSEFDIFMSSCSDARQFGRKFRRVTILR